ncbi:DUF4382 domain-containing protein [Halosimplex salinum]|uniref:DUF4382 domain-containing protein n=1 Tax=Halosimplex salinum TaxID=1710538 RepID=UPI000F4770E8|nr:DUF4382 domain-containing protein [Halosimplex salinum]
MRRAFVALATALLVVTAGCAATPGTGTPSVGGADDGDGAGTSDGDGTTDSDSTDAGTVNFYVSDEPNDMDDFEHLNVTISSVQFHLVDAANESADDENASTATATATAANGTDSDGDATETDVDDTVANETDADDEKTEEEAEEREDEEKDEKDEESGDGRWVTRDVNASSVDLSQLRGANATLLQQFDLPAGEYDKVHMEVSEVNGTLTDGESANVKLPSNKLQLNSQFTVENGSEVDFVYDVTVHEAGNSGKYILKPVVSESGTEVPIERVDDDDDRDDERSISASFVGNVSAGENVTVLVTENGSAVENATVSVDDGAAGTTNADGEYVVSVPDDAEELEIEVEDGDAEAELEVEFEEEDGDDGDEADAAEDGSTDAQTADA